MDLKSLVFGIPFLVIGSLFVLFAGRFGRWLTPYSFENKTTFLSKKDKELTKEEYTKKNLDTWPRRGFWLLWLFLIRIIGVMLALGGVFMILQAKLDN